MRLLLDANLSPRLVESLRQADHDAVHVVEVGLATATDAEIFDHAVADCVSSSSLPTATSPCCSPFVGPRARQ
jgi:predicted nuclease of predicted toxin-antitoxin system